MNTISSATQASVRAVLPMILLNVEAAYKKKWAGLSRITRSLVNWLQREENGSQVGLLSHAKQLTLMVVLCYRDSVRMRILSLCIFRTRQHIQGQALLVNKERKCIHYRFAVYFSSLDGNDALSG